MTRLAIEHAAVNLAQGFPDFPPPPEIIAAAHAALDRGENQYTVTWGIPPLREAIGAKMKRRYGLDYAPDRHIAVTCGVTEAIVAAVMAVVDPGDEVIIVEPFHENYLPAVRFAGGTPVYFALEPPHYHLDPERLRRAFGKRTRAILLNSPHNPSGRVFDREELAGVARLCQEFDAIAITDEIYEHILYDGRAHLPIASLDGMQERTITIGGFGKTFAVTGWRLGYACALEPLAEELVRDGALRDRGPLEIRVEAIEQARPPRRLRLARPEAANPGFAKQVIAGEHLVGAFAGEHHGHAGLAHHP